MLDCRADRYERDETSVHCCPTTRMILAIRSARMHVKYVSGSVANCFDPPNRLQRILDKYKFFLCIFLVKILLTKFMDCFAMSQAVSHRLAITEVSVGWGQSMNHGRWTE